MTFRELRERLHEAKERYDDTHNFTCDICGREIFDGRRVCAPCLAALPANDGKICPFCGRAVVEDGACLLCKDKPLGTEKTRSPYRYEREAARLVVRAKRGQAYLARTLAELSLPLAEREFADIDLIVPVPMTERARKERGYNQTELFAHYLGKAWGKEVFTGVIKRKDTGSQKTLGRREREENLTGCFHVSRRKEVKGKRVLILDDVMTTGATVGVLTDTLKRAGAAKVCALTFASAKQYVLSKAQRAEQEGKKGS